MKEITKELDLVFTKFLELFDDECKTILKNNIIQCY